VSVNVTPISRPESRYKSLPPCDCHVDMFFIDMAIARTLVVRLLSA
jgi:hypothetical protein